jgi:hypothetical protein
VLTRRRPTVGAAIFAAATLISVAGVALLAAQEPPRIQVAPTITAAADSQGVLAIDVGPPGAVPAKSFLTLRGLPPSVALTDAHAIDPGSWAVPLASLPALKAVIPASISGQSEITISLIALDGRLLSQAKTTLVIQRASVGAATPKTPVGSSAAAPGAQASSPIERTPKAQDKARALGFLKKGEELFAAGNVGAARLFYERAADAGLPEGALALAATFDPNELTRRNVLGGVQPDRAAARRWYERARELGALEAEQHLQRLAREN